MWVVDGLRRICSHRCACPPIRLYRAMRSFPSAMRGLVFEAIRCVPAQFLLIFLSAFFLMQGALVLEGQVIHPVVYQEIFRSNLPIIKV